MAAEGKGNLGIPRSVAVKMISEDKPGKLPYHVKRASGGLAGLAGGGLSGDPSPIDTRGPGTQLAREIHMPNGGFLNSGIAGRTDRIPASVAADSFVMPADVISGLGQGNSLSGARIMSQALKMGPWGTALPAHRGGMGPPRPPAPFREEHASGGLAANDNTQAKVLVAGGEFSVPPEFIKRLGGGDLKTGHIILRRMVSIVRADTIARLKKLPSPKRSMGGIVMGLAA